VFASATSTLFTCSTACNCCGAFWPLPFFQATDLEPITLGPVLPPRDDAFDFEGAERASQRRAREHARRWLRAVRRPAPEQRRALDVRAHALRREAA